MTEITKKILFFFMNLNELINKNRLPEKRKYEYFVLGWSWMGVVVTEIHCPPYLVNIHSDGKNSLCDIILHLFIVTVSIFLEYTTGEFKKLLIFLCDYLSLSQRPPGEDSNLTGMVNRWRPWNNIIKKLP